LALIGIYDSPFALHMHSLNSGSNMDQDDENEPTQPYRRRADPRNEKPFTDLSVRKLRVPKVGQLVYWDVPAPRRGGVSGLSVLASAGGTKTYRATFYLPDPKGEKTTTGKLKRIPITYRLGNIEEMTLTMARALTRKYRGDAEQGIDPRAVKQQAAEAAVKAAAARITYAQVVEKFIERHARPSQRTWYQTQRVLRVSGKSLLTTPFADITKAQVRELLETFVNDGHPYKAAAAQSWFKKLWRWAAEQDLVPIAIMDSVRVNFERRDRDRVYSDDEIKATWDAANQLPEPSAGAYVKLLMLLAPRKRELAWMTWSYLDDAENPKLWETPFELTKSRKNARKKRKYFTPLPPLAQRILKGLPKGGPEDRVFPAIRVNIDKGGNKVVHDEGLKDALVARGAPRDFMPHAWRHTVATFLGKRHTEWEVGLVLNHSGSSVTAGYMHGTPGEWKLQLLEEWAAHVEALVQPADSTNVVVLR
jgi:integrase